MSTLADALRQVSALGTVGEEQDLLKEQLRQAIALRQAPKQQHYGALGAALGGLGDILNTYRSHRDEREIREAQQGLLQKQEAGRNAFTGSMSDLLRQPGPVNPVGPGMMGPPTAPQAARAERAEREAAAARSAALRGLAFTGLASGDPAIGRSSQAIVAQLGEEHGDARALENWQRQREAHAQDMKAQQVFARDQMGAQQAFQLKLAGINNAAELERARAAANARETKGTVVPGMEVVPGAEPTADDAKKMKAINNAAIQMRGLVGRLRELHQKHGTEFTGPVATEMKQILTGIKLNGKTLADLGALSGPDEALMNALSGYDPTSLTSNLKSLVGVDQTQAALDGVDKWIANQEQGNQKAYGYKPVGGTGGSGGRVRVVGPDGKSGTIDAAELAEAEKNGYRRAE